MHKHHHRRRYSRSKVSITAILTAESGMSFDAEVVDLSMSGMFMRTEQILTPGSLCEVKILLGHLDHELPIITNGVVIRVFKGGMAVRFESVKLEAISHMQSFITAHADNPEQSQLEFSSQGGWVFTP